MASNRDGEVLRSLLSKFADHPSATFRKGWLMGELKLAMPEVDLALRRLERLGLVSQVNHHAPLRSRDRKWVDEDRSELDVYLLARRASIDELALVEGEA